MPFGLQEALWAAHAPDGDVYPSQPALSLHLVEQLIARDFDVSRFRASTRGAPSATPSPSCGAASGLRVTSRSCRSS